MGQLGDGDCEDEAIYIREMPVFSLPIYEGVRILDALDSDCTHSNLLDPAFGTVQARVLRIFWIRAHLNSSQMLRMPAMETPNWIRIRVNAKTGSARDPHLLI